TQLYHKYSLFLNTTAAPKSYPLSLHDALPILTSARSPERLEFGGAPPRATQQPRDIAHARGAGRNVLHSGARQERRVVEPREHLDRKSTRLNSSHVAISYAVFCLEKKNTTYIA